ncbi:hypothetical protein AAE478_005703 [Parahypoxylon ruwenzoriense]
MRFTNFALAAFSMGSALAVPTTHQAHARQLQILGTATATVGSVKTTVEAELATIAKLVVNVNLNATTLVPQLEHALLNIASDITGIVGSVLPLVTEGVPTLVEDELKAVPELLNNVLTIANDVEATAQQLVNGLAGDVLKAVKPELQLVLATIQPIAKPIVTFALSAVGTVAGPVAEEVNGLVGDVEKVLGGLLAPLGGVLSIVL